MLLSLQDLQSTYLPKILKVFLILKFTKWMLTYYSSEYRGSLTVTSYMLLLKILFPQFFFLYSFAILWKFDAIFLKIFETITSFSGRVVMKAGGIIHVTTSVFEICVEKGFRNLIRVGNFEIQLILIHKIRNLGIGGICLIWLVSQTDLCMWKLAANWYRRLISLCEDLYEIGVADWSARLIQ